MNRMSFTYEQWLQEGWMNMKGGRFTADMSEISHHSKDTGKDVHCPGCKAKLKLSDFKERRDDENEVTTWTLKHDCGADLTIFNESAKPTFKQFLLREAKKQVADIDEMRELLADKGSAADMWMGAPNLEKLLKHVNGGGKFKCVTVDCSSGEDKHERNEIMDKRVAKLKDSGWEVLDYEWDGDDESVDIVLVNKPLAEAKSTHKDGDMVKPHDYSVKILSKGKDKKWPALKGEIYEKDVLIGTFSRGAVRDNFIPPIEAKFRTDRSKARFDDFADSLSIGETIEALLP
jgi:hypothetical protein